MLKNHFATLVLALRPRPKHISTLEWLDVKFKIT